MGAVIYTRQYILGSGFNYIIGKSLKRFGSKFSVHAEMMALFRSLRKHNEHIVRGSSIEVYQLKNEGLVKIRPCPECLGMLKKYGVKVE
jgi:hypothetical protein